MGELLTVFEGVGGETKEEAWKSIVVFWLELFFLLCRRCKAFNPHNIKQSPKENRTLFLCHLISSFPNPPKRFVFAKMDRSRGGLGWFLTAVGFFGGKKGMNWYGMVCKGGK